MKRYIVCYRELKINSSINTIEIDASYRTDAYVTAKNTLKERFGNDSFTLWVYAYRNKKTNNLHCFCTFDGEEIKK